MVPITKIVYTIIIKTYKLETRHNLMCVSYRKTMFPLLKEYTTCVFFVSKLLSIFKHLQETYFSFSELNMLTDGTNLKIIVNNIRQYIRFTC